MTETIVDAPAWNEPVYDEFYICARCGYMTQDNMTIVVHCVDTHEAEGGASWSVEPVQVGIIEHKEETHTVTRCSSCGAVQ